ncbi:fructokinase [Sporosarcina luteola]|nr:fructokinase [Sporosarcina luteola]
MKQVLVYGDAFVDYVADDATNRTFTTHVGGTTVNVAVGVSRLGVPASYITVTGDDDTSSDVRKKIEKEGVDLAFAKRVPEKRVSGVVVHLTEGFERIFHSYIDETPDIQVEPEDLQEEAFDRASIFHFASGTMFHSTALQTTRKAVTMAKQRGLYLSFDANIRLKRWTSETDCRETIGSFLSVVDLVKVTEEELFFLTGAGTVEEGIRLLAGHAIPILLVTAGERGTIGVIGSETFHVGVAPVEVVDTTGAGDAFMAGILRELYKKGVPGDRQGWIEIIRFANRIGALATTKQGALTALPRINDL